VDSASDVLANMNIIFVSVLPQQCVCTLFLALRSLFLSLLLHFQTCVIYTSSTFRFGGYWEYYKEF
jgi:hypothetical protein